MHTLAILKMKTNKLITQIDELEYVSISNFQMVHTSFMNLINEEISLSERDTVNVKMHLKHLELKNVRFNHLKTGNMFITLLSTDIPSIKEVFTSDIKKIDLNKIVKNIYDSLIEIKKFFE